MDLSLNDTRRAILAAPGHLLIQGGPGCGKTTIALLKAAAFADTLEPEQHVLFLSFSRAAVRQISDRMRGLLPPAARDRLEIRTFHAFFLELVRAHGPLLTGVPSSFIAPDREQQMRADFDGDWGQETRRLAGQGRYVFDRLADTAATLLHLPAVGALYRNTYPLIIIDEFQDTNEDQWRAVQALGQTSTVVCLADPDQRIFDHLEGVDEKRIEQVIEYLNPTLFDLSEDNHRSPDGGLLEYANAVLRNTPMKPPSTVITRIYTWPDTFEAMVHRVIIALQNHLQPQLGRPPTIAVLTPTNRLVAQISEAITTDQADPLAAGKVLPAIDHDLNWDPNLSAAAGHVVASILEWPARPRLQALTATLNAVADFYRVKLTGGTIGARSKIRTIVNAVTALQAGRPVRAKAAKTLAQYYDTGIELQGEPVGDWQLARARLRGASDLEEIASQARLLRLFKATDALAWALIDIWNGSNAYTSAAAAVRGVLTNETLDAVQAEPAAVTLMTMHKSKGKEFDAVIIAERKYALPLLDPDWDKTRTQRARRVLRVALTRPRHGVILVRPDGVPPLTG